MAEDRTRLTEPCPLRGGPPLSPHVTTKMITGVLRRDVVGKLSDARERLHLLVERARREASEAEASAPSVWPNDLNAEPSASKEADRG